MIWVRDGYKVILAWDSGRLYLSTDIATTLNLYIYFIRSNLHEFTRVENHNMLFR